ncbi:MAG: DUF835 domain-containing protein [Methanobacteriota archaeon]|nr:MAG: DUF835 domain-containing protein [Euryarchaeota archaeon]
MIIGLVWSSDLVLRGIAPGPLGYDASVGSGYLIMAVIYTAQIVAALVVLLGTYRMSEVQIIKKRSKILLMGVAVPVIVGSVTETFLPVLMDIPTRLGIGSIYTVIMGIFAAYAIMKYKLLVIEPATEVFRPPKMEYLLEVGHNNLIESTSSEYAYNAFRNIVSDTPGLCVTTTYPEKVRQQYGLEKTPIIWISKMSKGETTFKPSDLNFEVSQSATQFMRDNPRTSILLEDLEYLVQTAGFKSVLRFVKIIADVGSANRSTVVVSVNPSALEDKEIATVRKSFDSINEIPHVEGLPGRAIYSPAVCVLFEDRQDLCYDQFRRESMERTGLFITTTFPGKISKRQGFTNTDFIWLSETRELPGAIDPSELKYEALRDVTKFAEDNPTHVILFEGLEYLSSSAGFPEVLEFLQYLIDLVSSEGTKLLVPIHPSAFNDREMGTLKRRFDQVVS